MKRNKSVDYILISDPRAINYRNKIIDKMFKIMSEDNTLPKLSDYTSNIKTTI